jgi:DNA-binding FrmR family transcriptional regulator
MRERFPDHQSQLTRLAKIEGQIKGIRKMVEERRYCMDIVQQIKAATAGLKQVQMGVLEKHIHMCMQEAVASRKPGLFEEKLEEILSVISRMQ